MRWFRWSMGDWFMVVVAGHMALAVLVTLMLTKTQAHKPIHEPADVAFHLGDDDENLLVSVDGQILQGELLDRFCERINTNEDVQLCLSKEMKFNESESVHGKEDN